jgi:hypothetical protein
MDGTLIQRFFSWSGGEELEKSKSEGQDLSGSQRLILSCITSLLGTDLRRAIFKSLSLVCEKAEC